MVEKMADKEELVAAVLVELPLAKYSRHDENKRQALERYMRTFLRNMTPFELDFELKQLDSQHGLTPTLQFRLDKASRGYDAFMAKRQKVAA